MDSESTGGSRRRLLTIIYDSSIEASMAELLDALEVPGLTRVFDVLGRGGRGTKGNSPVFPGTNNMVLIAAEPSEVEQIRRAVRRLQGAYRLKPGITMLVQEVEVLP